MADLFQRAWLVEVIMFERRTGINVSGIFPSGSAVLLSVGYNCKARWHKYVSMEMNFCQQSSRNWQLKLIYINIFQNWRSQYEPYYKYENSKYLCQASVRNDKIVMAKVKDLVQVELIRKRLHLWLKCEKIFRNKFRNKNFKGF